MNKNISNPEVKEVNPIVNDSTTEKKTKKVKKDKKAKAEKVSKKKEAKKEAKVKKQVKKQVENNLIEQVISNREVKYIYPEDCTDTLSRKKHRQKIRNKLHALELEMHRIEDKNSEAFKAKRDEYLKFKKENLKEGAAA